MRTAGVNGTRYRIDGKDTVIFTLPNGDSIRDNSKKIHFGARDNQTKLLVEKLAQAKWGPPCPLDNDVLKSKLMTYTPI